MSHRSQNSTEAGFARALGDGIMGTLPFPALV